VNFDGQLPPHVELLVVPSGADGKTCLTSFAQLIYQKGFYKILIESGYVLYKSLVATNLIDECLFFVANRNFEESIGYSVFPEFKSIAQANYLSKFSLNRKMKINQDIFYEYFIYNK
jgi:riboflavin biosynthesis pyrimidine reductase